VKTQVLDRLAIHVAKARAQQRPVLALWEEAELAKLEQVLGELIPESGPSDL